MVYVCITKIRKTNKVEKPEICPRCGERYFTKHGYFWCCNNPGCDYVDVPHKTIDEIDGLKDEE